MVSYKNNIDRKYKFAPNVNKRTSTINAKSKSDNMIYGQGDDDKDLRKALTMFVTIYNDACTIDEQKDIGDIWYILLSKSGMVGKGSFDFARSWVDNNRMINGKKKRLSYVEFSRLSSTQEQTIIHEIMHLLKFSKGIPLDQHNEHKIDFETTARLSPKGIKEFTKTRIVKDKNGAILQMHGFYYTDAFHTFKPTSNKTAEKEALTLKKEIDNGVIEDRRLLTGSINKSIKGKIAEKKTKELFAQSFFKRK